MNYLPPKYPPWKDESNPYGPPESLNTATPINASALVDLENRIAAGLESVVQVAQSIIEAWGGVQRGPYSAGTSYNQNDIVTYNGFPYGSLRSDNEGHEPDTSAGWWVLLLDNYLTGEGLLISPSGGDDTAQINAAANVGHVRFAAGVFIVEGVVTFPYEFTQQGMGPTYESGTVFNLGPAGQIVIADPHDYGSGFATGSPQPTGGIVGGFGINGQQTNNVDGGLKIEAGISRTYQDISVQFCEGDNVHVEGVQNCVFHNMVFQSSGGSCLVLDNGTGGNRFFGGEISGGSQGSLRFQQTTSPSTGGYPTFLGPSDNTFTGIIFEYPGAASLALDASETAETGAITATAPAQIWHGAGTLNKFYSCAINQQGASVPNTSVLKLTSDANAYTAMGTWEANSQYITLTEAPPSDAVTALMVVGSSGLGFPVWNEVAGISGNVIEVFVPMTEAQATPVEVGFGALSTDLMMHDIFWLGNTNTQCIETNGSARIWLSGAQYMEGEYAFSCCVGDVIDISGYLYNQCTNFGKQNPADTSTDTFNFDEIVGHLSYGAQTVYTQNVESPAWQTIASGQNFSNVAIGNGNIFLTDGTFPPSPEVAWGCFTDDTDGRKLLASINDILAPGIRASGYAGFTTWARFMGILDGAGPPEGLASDVLKGDFVIDTNGVLWLSTVTGSNTWVSPNSTDGVTEGVELHAPAVGWQSLTPAADGVKSLSADMRYLKETSGFVTLDGLLVTTGDYRAGTAIFPKGSLSEKCRPKSVKYFATAFSENGGSGSASGLIAVSPDGSVELHCNLPKDYFINLNHVRFPVN